MAMYERNESVQNVRALMESVRALSGKRAVRNGVVALREARKGSPIVGVEALRSQQLIEGPRNVER